MKVKKYLVFVIVPIVAATLFVMSFVTGHRVIEHIFPKAELIACPKIECITSILLAKDNEDPVLIDKADYEAILRNIQDTQPTRTMSVNDWPMVDSYYTIKIDASEREYPYYIYLYEDESELFLEIPYEGIYKTNQQFYDFVATYFEE